MHRPADRAGHARRAGRMPGERRGFTLAELMVVLAMLGIAAAVAVPALRPPAGKSAAAAADSLRHVLARARADAATRGTPVIVRLRSGDGAFAVETLRDGGAGDSLAAGTLPLPPDGRIIGGRDGIARVVFDAAGRARADRVVMAEGDERIGVEVDPWSGDARAAP